MPRHALEVPTGMADAGWALRLQKPRILDVYRQHLLSLGPPPLGCWSIGQYTVKDLPMTRCDLLSLLVTGQEILTMKCSVALVAGEAGLLMAELVSSIFGPVSVTCSPEKLVKSSDLKCSALVNVYCMC